MNKKKKYIVITSIVLVVIAALAFITYFVCEKNKNIDLDNIKSEISNSSSYNSLNMQDITTENMEDIFSIKSYMVKKVVGEVPLLAVDSSMFVILEVEDEYKDEVKNALNEYALNLENEWKNYLEKEYELVTSRKIGTKGKYVYMIIADDVNEVESYIK